MKEVNNFNPGEEKMESMLWEFIDGQAIGEERSVIERLISENAEWRLKYQELLEVHQLIGSTELEQPSMRFTRNVMEEIAKYQIAPAAKKYIDNKIVFGIGMFFIVMILGFIIYGVAQIDWSVASDSQSRLGIDLDRVDYSPIFSNNFVNVFMMLNVILGLFLFDRYLNDRKKKYFQDA